MADFPALNGQSVSYAVLQDLAGSANPPHTDTPAAELLLLTYCIIEFIWAENNSRIVVVSGSRVTSDIMLIDGLIKKGGVMVGR
ncbi:hypothetical protein Gohar_003430 [Gossypium harknessii]|uniref:Cupin type-1 domain-containing protein n=1 Tax=Gossypium harknessii TaxID=34285 RepID=A0A7J9HRP8_9ROSI|nr:hypothetical protein [Gossypium harknessii]